MGENETGENRMMTDPREQRVRERMAQLQACGGDYRALDAEQTAKRVSWWVAHRDTLALSGPLYTSAPLYASGPLPRQAYTLFLLLYLGLDPSEVPIVYEDERKIVWRSFNFCPTLAACVRLGLDTREVCRQGTEGSVQTLIARLDPRLRFTRNYTDGIRPYAPYCEEWVELIEQF
jgi:hypothetical protein